FAGKPETEAPSDFTTVPAPSSRYSIGGGGPGARGGGAGGGVGGGGAGGRGRRETGRAQVIEAGVEPLAGAHDDVVRLVLAQRVHALGPGLVPRLRRALARWVGVGRALRVAVALDDEAGAVADLRGGRLSAEVPDQRRQQV